MAKRRSQSDKDAPSHANKAAEPKSPGTGSKQTIRDIAQMAGVCIGTVSRVINNKDKVHPETRQQILDLIERTGYRPSAMGRGLALRRSHNILLEVINISDAYSAWIAKNISNHCRSCGYKMLLGDSNLDPAVEADYLRKVRDGSVDGLIVSPLPTKKNVAYFRELAETGFPTVVIDNPVPGVSLPCVKYDDLAAGHLAMNHLFQQGHRRIAFLAWRTAFATVKDRLRGYRQGHQQRGLAVDEALVILAPESFVTWQPELLNQALQLPDPPTAIVTENEVTAVLCMNSLLRLGRRIPDDVAVMTFGDALSEQFFPVPLTTVSLCQDKASLKAIELLVELIEHPERVQEPAPPFIQQPELIVRQSA